MRIKTKTIGSVLIALSAIVACMQDELSPPTGRKPTAAEYLRKQIEQKDISLPDCRLRDGKVTKSALDIDYDVKEFSIDWKNYQALNGKTDRVWMFHMKTPTPIMGHVYAREGETVKKRATQVTFKLMVIKKGKKGTSRIITYIPEPKYLRNEQNKSPEELDWNLGGTNYSGLVLSTRLNGELVFGLKYEKGRVAYRFAPRKDGETIRSGLNRTEKAGTNTHHLCFGLHYGKSTRGSYSDGEGDNEDYSEHVADQRVCAIVMTTFALSAGILWTNAVALLSHLTQATTLKRKIPTCAKNAVSTTVFVKTEIIHTMVPTKKTMIMMTSMLTRTTILTIARGTCPMKVNQR